MHETKAAIIVLILISSVILCRSQQLNRRQLLQQQIQDKIQQRQQQQLERQLERQNEEELQNELILIQPNNISNIISNQSFIPQISSIVNQSEIDGRPAAINQALLLDGIFNIPIQALRVVNDLVRFITTNFQIVTTAFRPPTSITPAPDAESFDF